LIPWISIFLISLSLRMGPLIVRHHSVIVNQNFGE
jgi:hypothetical protein